MRSLLIPQPARQLNLVFRLYSGENKRALYKGIQELSLTTQTDSTEAEKSQKEQIEARNLAKALTNSDSQTKAILLVGTRCDTSATTLCQNLRRENHNLSTQHSQRQQTD